jgi:hypothetical protein
VVSTVILGTIFIAVGYFLRQSLKLWSEELEEKARPMITFSVCVLCIPLFTRSIYNLLWQVTDFDDQMEHSIEDDTILAPLITFFFILTADFVPITSQLISMLVIVDDAGSKRETGYDSNIHEGSEYIESMCHNISDKGSFLSEEDVKGKHYRVNSSRDIMPGLAFKTTSFDNLADTGANVGTNEDSYDDSD